MYSFVEERVSGDLRNLGCVVDIVRGALKCAHIAIVEPTTMEKIMSSFLVSKC